MTYAGREITDVIEGVRGWSVHTRYREVPTSEINSTVIIEGWINRNEESIKIVDYTAEIYDIFGDEGLRMYESAKADIRALFISLSSIGKANTVGDSKERKYLERTEEKEERETQQEIDERYSLDDDDYPFGLNETPHYDAPYTSDSVRQVLSELEDEISKWSQANWSMPASEEMNKRLRNHAINPELLSKRTYTRKIGKRKDESEGNDGRMD